MRILAADQATHCGWAVIDADSGEIVDSGCKDFSKTERYLRMRDIASFLWNLFVDYECEHIYIEDIYYLKNIQTLEWLSGLKSHIMSTFQTRGTTPCPIYPVTWKKAYNLNGRKRNEQKKTSQEIAKERYHIDVVDDNEADAILIGMYAITQATTP